VWPPGPATHKHSPPLYPAWTSPLTSPRMAAAAASHHQLGEGVQEEEGEDPQGGNRGQEQGQGMRGVSQLGIQEQVLQGSAFNGVTLGCFMFFSPGVQTVPVHAADTWTSSSNH
jgi:hypothetical protein